MGMRCKMHPHQAGGGVCATCLRDRLLALTAAQNDASSSPSPPAAPAAFPRSLSPYVSRRKSDSSGSALRHHLNLLFFRTPQVGPTYGGCGALEEGDIGYEKRRVGKFSILATLFGQHHHHHHRSEDKDKGGSKERKNRSCFVGIIPGRRKKQVPAAEALPLSPPPRRSCRVVSNRGLSPERDSNGSGEESNSPADLSLDLEGHHLIGSSHCIHCLHPLIKGRCFSDSVSTGKFSQGYCCHRHSYKIEEAD